MAGFDQFFQIRVTLRVVLPEVPRGHMKRGDSGGTPTRGEVIGIDAGAIGGIEERPQAGGAERCFESEIRQRQAYLFRCAEELISIDPSVTFYELSV